MESNSVVKALAALAQPSRLEAFRALVVAGDAGLTPGVLSAALQVAPNRIYDPASGRYHWTAPSGQQQKIID